MINMLYTCVLLLTKYTHMNNLNIETYKETENGDLEINYFFDKDDESSFLTIDRMDVASYVKDSCDDIYRCCSTPELMEDDLGGGTVHNLFDLKPYVDYYLDEDTAKDLVTNYK